MKLKLENETELLSIDSDRIEYTKENRREE